MNTDQTEVRSAECGLPNADCGIKLHASRTTHHVSRLTFHVSRFTHQPLRTPHSALRTRSAFTLLELLMVIAIMGILAALALPTVRGLKPNAKAAGSRQLLDAVNRARQLAISQRTTVYMVFASTNFWGDAASGSWNANDRAIAQTLYDKQLTAYAYLCLRSVGDQPGMHTARYLSSWRTLPSGAYISPEKFIPTTSASPPVLTITTNGGMPAYRIYGFNYTNNLPFPAGTNLAPYINLPYIAFDGMGTLVSGVSGQPELIPISEGSVSVARDPASKDALRAIPQVTERPLGNTVDNYSLISIDRLTGRARVERRKVQ